jgi:hypothetical protein
MPLEFINNNREGVRKIIRNQHTLTNLKFMSLLFIQIVIILTYILNLSYHPINHLFVDDWVIFKDFSLNNSGLNAVNLTSYNGNPLFFSRLLFIFATDTLGLSISTMAFILFGIYTLVLYIFATKVTNEMSNKNWARAGIMVIGLNLNQYQNFVMPICWPWIVSLIIFYISYLLSINYKSNMKYFSFSILILISPQIFSLGFILPIGVLLINLALVLAKDVSVKKISLIAVSLISISLSYYISIGINNDAYEKTLGIYPLIDNPLRAFGFVLSSIGAPFTPASKYSTVISITFGFIILVLVMFTLKQRQFKGMSNAKNLIWFGLIFHALQLIARFDGSQESIKVVNQPRYTTGALILLLGLFLAYVPSNLSKSKFLTVYLTLAVMSMAGAKTSFDFADIRGNASANIENCVIKSGYYDEVCVDLLNPGTEILSLNEFTDALKYISSKRPS